MGISGLLPALKDIQVHGNISEFKGKRLAVDAYVWLHRGAFGCAEEIVKGQQTTKYVDYAMYRVRLLRHHGIEPYVVFDGGPLPAKKKTESSREKSRADALARARNLESQGRKNDARDAYTKCVDITPEMAFQLIKALRAGNVDYVVAPYEADAQLCFLEREGYVDGIITEDSDLLVFGCKQVIFKLEGNGKCVWIKSDKLATITDFPMHGWTDVQFRRMAMLSGCDYLDSIPGIGLKTAHRLLRRHKTVEKVVQMIRLEGTLSVPVNYIKSFAQAELAFIHQRIFDPASKKLVPLNDFPLGGLSEDDQKWVGLDMDLEVARGVARGDIHPETLVPIEDIAPGYLPLPRANGGKVPTGPVCKTKVAGPMDAFISRAKITRPLPVPVGKLGPGVSRLSERNINKVLDPPPRASVVKKSKFFGSKAEVHEESITLKWESSDGASQQADNIAGPSRSPSPSFSVISHPKADAEDSLNHLTSPVAPNMSSPAMSSPPDFETLTSPRARRTQSHSRSATPVSPTRTIQSTHNQAVQNILIPSTSQIPHLSPTPHHSPTPRHIPTSSSSAPVLPSHNLGTSTFSNHPSSDTDSIDIEEVVTPSLPTEHQKKRSSTKTKSRDSLGKRQREEEEEEEEVTLEEKEREEKAKTIAKDWRLKYAFGGMNTPTVRPSKPRSKSDQNTPLATSRTKALLPLSSTVPRSPRILGLKPANIPEPAIKDDTSMKGTNEAAKTIKRSGPTLIPSSNLAGDRVGVGAGAQRSSSPISDGSSSSSLARFRFASKINTRQLSSPSL